MIFFYLTVIILWITYFSYQTGSIDANVSKKNGLELTAITSIGIALIGPIIALVLFKLTDGDIAKVGPVGDLMSGSTVPFLTFGAFILAYATFNSQKQQLKLVKDESDRQAKALDIQRFENTFFILIDEIKKAEQNLQDKSINVVGLNSSDIVLMIKKNCHISKDEFEELLEEFSLSQLKNDESLFRVNEFILDRYLSKITETLYQNKYYYDIDPLYKIVKKIFQLVVRHNLEEKDAKYYLEFIEIHLSIDTLIILIYNSLLELTTDNGMFDFIVKYRFHDIMQHSERTIHSINDYKLFEYLRNLDSKQRRKIDPYSFDFSEIINDKNNTTD